MLLPPRYMPHGGQVRYQSKHGESTYGPLFAPPVTPERAAVDEKQKLVRTADGSMVMSSARIVLDPEHDLPVGSLVTLHPDSEHERQTTVLITANADWPLLPKFREYTLE